MKKITLSVIKSIRLIEVKHHLENERLKKYLNQNILSVEN